MPLRASEDVVAHRRVGRQSDETAADFVHELSLRVASPIGEQQQHNHNSKKPVPASPDGDAKRSRSANAPSKILFLDGVRGIAAVLVVTQHCGYMFGVNLGHCAVDMFFVLSSFLLTWLFYKKSEQLINQKASLRKWGFALADYFSKRFFRVYPLFAIVAVFVWLLPDEAKQRYFRVAKPEDYHLFPVLTFQFDSRFHVFWTLPLEIAYYFLIPVIVLLAIGLGKGWWIPFGPLLIWIYTRGWNDLRGDHQPLSMHLPTFVCGSLAAILYVKIDAAIKRQAPAFEFTKWHVIILRGVEIVTFWLLLSVFYRSLWFDWFITHPHQVEAGARFISFHVTLLILIEMVLPSALSTALEWNVLRHWGKIGFSVYLLHSFVIYAEPIRSQENYYDKLVSQFFLIHVLATVSFHLIEVPCQKISLKISKELTAMEKGNDESLVAYKTVALHETLSAASYEGSLLPVVAGK